MSRPLSLALRRQRTLARPTAVNGFGYWSGRDVRLEFRPAPPHSGVVFVRSDLARPRRIPARSAYRVEAPRRTALEADGARVEMVEHVLAALVGLGVDNCEIWTDGEEMPGCDGSSRLFCERLAAAGITSQPAPRPALRIWQPVRVGSEESWVAALPDPRPGLHVNYWLDYSDAPAIGRQSFSLTVTPESFVRELAAARTFVLREEAEWLRRYGLGARVTCKDLLVFDDVGPMDNELRFSDECVRHKTLDLVGDLALAGCDLHGRILAHRSGHRQNALLVQALLAQARVADWKRAA